MSYGMGNQGAQMMQGPLGKSGNKIPSGYQAGQIQQFTPEQMQLFGQLFGHLGPDSFTSKLAGGDQDTFNQMEAPALKQFAGIQGGLASRFSNNLGAGGGGQLAQGGRNSSGFQNTMNQAGSDFASQLQSNRQGLQRQALQDLMGMSNNLLNQRPYETFLGEKKKNEPYWKKLLGLVSPVGGDIASGGTDNTQQFLQALMAMA